MSDPSFEPEQSPHKPSVWRDNHGNLILIVTGVILLVGAISIGYQQLSFRKVRFPDSRSITSPDELIEERELQARQMAASQEDPTGNTSESPSVGEADLTGEGNLTVRAIGAINDDGEMMVAVYHTAKEFNKPAKAILKASKEINDGVAEWTFPVSTLPQYFAVAAFHDEDKDGLLNRNKLGIPTERYGFSNKARGSFGPPTFDQAVISRPSGDAEIEIYIR